jgi:membrane associated rhomboid family serine protease
MPIRLTPTVKALLIAQVAIFLIQKTADKFFGGNLEGIFALIPSAFVVKHYVWQIFTYAFLHHDPMHLILNTLMLALIGGELESSWGPRRFLSFFFTCSVFAGICYLLMQVLFPGGEGLNRPMVGSSGAIYGLLIAYGILYSERQMLFMMLFPMKAKHFIWILAAVEFFSAVFSPSGGLSSVAHLGGMLAGFFYLWGQAYWLRSQRARKSKPPKKGGKHLKLVINNVKGFDKDGESKSSEDPKTWH